MQTTKTEINAILKVAAIITEAVQAAGARGIPDGHLYAMLQSTIGQNWDLNLHQQVIGLLVEAGKITNTGHLLKAK